MDLIKERLYYTIGEVASLLDVNASAVRYWEKHFDMLKPSKRTGTSKRRYDVSDIKILYRIKTLLKEENVSIKKAKTALCDWKPDISFEELKESLDVSKRPAKTLSKADVQFAQRSLSEIKTLLKNIK